MQQVKAVNLGGWLVLEKWITPSVFTGTYALDEYDLCKQLGSEKTSRLKTHRDTFITEKDFAWIAQQGFNTVRLPVPYWLFDDITPYLACKKYVDIAFAAASTHNLSVILDLHTAPGSQNGSDHSGKSGAIEWHRDIPNITSTLEVLSKICEQYGAHPQLLAIEVLNEPHKTIPIAILQDFYSRAYRIIRDVCGDVVTIILHDSFRPNEWKKYLQAYNFVNIVLDIHFYQLTSWRYERMHVHKHLKDVSERQNLIAKLQQYVPVFAGEWSLALPQRALKGLDAYERDKALQAYNRLQQAAFGATWGWAYWTLKTEDGGAWSLEDSIRRGWLQV